MIVVLEDTTYSTGDEKAEFIRREIEDIVEQCIELFKESEEIMLESLVHFCNTGKFLDE